MIVNIKCIPVIQYMKDDARQVHMPKAVHVCIIYIFRQEGVEVGVRGIHFHGSQATEAALHRHQRKVACLQDCDSPQDWVSQAMVTLV